MDSDRVKLFDRIESELLDCIEFKSNVVENGRASGQNGRRFDLITLDFSQTPDFGHYGYAFVKLIRMDEEAGLISPGTSTLVETTSGTAGRGLAYAAELLGYPIRLYMPIPYHPRRLEVLKEFLEYDPRNTLIATDAAAYVAGAAGSMREYLAKEGRKGNNDPPRRIHALDHSRRPETVEAFAELIRHAWNEYPKDEFSAPVVSAGLGGGCLSTPFFSHFKSVFPKATCIGVEPLEAPVSFVKKYGEEAFEKKFGHPPKFGPHALPGTAGYDLPFPLLDLANVDSIYPIAKENVDNCFDVLNRKNSFHFGRSTCACINAAINFLYKKPKRTIIVPVYDRDDLYGDEDGRA